MPGDHPVPDEFGGSMENEKYRILLRVSQAANQQLEFGGVLEAISLELRPLVAFDLISVTTVEGEVFRPHAVYVTGVERRSGESTGEAITRGLHLSAGMVPASYPIAGTGVEHVAKTGRALVAQNLEEQQTFADDQSFLDFGIRAYVRTPLFVRDQLVGAITICRFRPGPFRDEEVTLLQDMAPVIATAVSNSLAYEEIRRLKDRLAAENLVLREEIDQQSMFEEIIGVSKALRRVLGRIEKVAPTATTVLITGETGTGKELVARAIHRRSPVATRALIKANCVALPASLIASELFGHERGAFTGAFQQRLGRFELATGGSIFLDEVGELPGDVQVTLLRVLQERDFERIGGTRTIHTDARVIAATNRDLDAAVTEGRFRRDLYYRLNVFPIEMPPLRDRREDIPLLVEYFVQRYSARLGKKLQSVARRTMEWLMGYSWPGNVRELQNVIERAVVLAEEEVLRIEESDIRPARNIPRGTARLPEMRDEEKRRIEDALSECRGRVAGPWGAAARLGVPNTTLEGKIKRHGIDKKKFRIPS